MVDMKRNFLVMTACGFISFLFVVALSIWQPISRYATFNSPSGDYELIVLKMKSPIPIFPGQSGDLPGVVLLRDNKGKTLYWATVNMVHLVDSPVWERDKVYVKLVFEFDLK